MPFSSNDSVDILIKARATGQQELDALRGSVEKVSGAERAHLDLLSKLDVTMKNVVTGVGSLTKALEEQNSGVNKSRQSLDEWEKRLNAIVSNPAYSINSPFSALGRAAQQAALSMGTMGTVALGASVGVAALAAGAVSLVNEMGQGARELQNFSLRLGLTVDQSQRLQIASKLAGVEMTSLEQSARLLGNALADGEGSGKKQVAALQQLGIATHEVNGQAREVGPVLLDVINKLSTLGNTAEVAHLGTVLLGRGFKELTPLIDQYGELTAAGKKFAESLGTDVNQKLIEGKKAISELDVAWDLFKKNLAAKIAPIVIPVVTFMANTIAAPTTNTKQGNLPKGAFDFSDLQTPQGSTQSPGDLASSNAITAHFDLIHNKTKEGYEAIIKTAKEKQAELSSIIHGLGVGADAKEKAVTGFNAQQRTIDNANAGIKGIADAKEAAKRLESLISEWTKKRDQAHAESLVDPAIKSKLGEITDEQSNALGENPKNAKLQNLIKETFNTKWVTEFNKELEQGNLESAKLTEKWEHLLMLSGKLTDRPEKDIRSELDKNDKRITGNFIEDARGVTAANRSDRIARFGMNSRFNSQMVGASAGPADQMHAFLGSQDQSKLEAYINLLQSLQAAEGQKDQHTQEVRANLLYARETSQIEMDTALKVAEIKKQQLEEDRKFLGEVFDAFQSGQRGAVGKLLKGQVTGIERTMFQNAFQVPLHSVQTGIQNFLTPHELNADGSANMFGKILQGTPFGINQASPEIKSRQDNTAALISLTNTLNGKGTGTSSGGGLNYTPVGSALSSLFPGAGAASSALGSIGKILSGSSNKPDDLTKDLAAITPTFLPNADGTMGAYYGGSSLSSSHSSSLGKGFSIGAAIAAGAGAVYAGIRQGGAQGTENAIAGGLGALSAIPGPQQPFVAAAAALTSLVSMFTGQSVEQRYKQMQNNVAGSYSRLPQAQNEQFDISGFGSDITGPGSARVLGGININVTAFDSKSVLDHWQPIADAVRHAMSMNHPVVDQARQVLR